MTFKEFATDIKTFYAGIVVVVGLMASTITFVLKVQSSSAEIDSLSKSNKFLIEQVATLQGAMEGVNNAVKLFLDNSPALLNYKVEELKKKVDSHHAAQPIATPDTSVFLNRTPH